VNTSAAVLERMNEAIDVADREAAKASLSAVKGLSTHDCSRCGGKGYDFFMGGERSPGVCFKCGGSGKVFASSKTKKTAASRAAQIELVRLRTCWKAVRTALTQISTLSPASGPDERTVRHTVARLERQLALYEKSGKELSRSTA
jgi:hypothetical protein